MSHQDEHGFDATADFAPAGGELPPADTSSGDETAPPPSTSPVPDPATHPADPGTQNPEQQLERFEQELQQEELALEQQLYGGEDPTVPPTQPADPTTPNDHTGHHPDPSSVPANAPIDVTYDAHGDPEQGTAPTSHVIGDPDADAGQWSFQGANGYCGPNSLSMILEQATGHKVSEGDVATWAIQHDEMTKLPAAEDSPEGVPSLHYGMLPQQAADTLNALGEQYGVTADYQDGGTMDDLESALKNGHEVMIEVDDESLWHEAGVPDSGQANHFVVVTGFDPSTNTVFLNDPGTPDGKEESIPLSEFKDAWGASNNAMITLDTSHATTGDNPAPPTTPSTGGSPAPMVDERDGGSVDHSDMSSWNGPILLPIVYSGSAS